MEPANVNVCDVSLGQESEPRHDSSRRSDCHDLAALDTYFGKRKPVAKVVTSLNMYDYIKSFELENISALPSIPDQYFKSLLLYIVQISRALSHCHKHDLVHGNYNMSKVMVQRLGEGTVTHTKTDHNFNEINFILANFEPYQVFRYLQIYEEEEPLMSHAL